VNQRFLNTRQALASPLTDLSSSRGFGARMSYLHFYTLVKTKKFVKILLLTLFEGQVTNYCRCMYHKYF
jgi:hypothetical protein